MMKKTVIYTTRSCPYCVFAKDLLLQKNVAFEEQDLTDDAQGREALIEKAGGQRTVPQIFIDGQHVGGFEALQAWFDKA